MFSPHTAVLVLHQGSVCLSLFVMLLDVSDFAFLIILVSLILPSGLFRLLSIIYRRAQVFNSQQRLAADDKHESDAAVVKPPPHIDQLRLHVSLGDDFKFN